MGEGILDIMHGLKGGWPQEINKTFWEVGQETDGGGGGGRGFV